MIRQLIAFVGNSIIVTSLIIGVFLLCLAYGYRAGGRQCTALLAILRRNFFISYVCQNDPENDQSIYTDNLNRASFDIFSNT